MGMLEIGYHCGFCGEEKIVYVNPNFDIWICCEAKGYIMQLSDIPTFFQIFNDRNIGSLFFMCPGEFSIKVMGKRMSPDRSSILVLRKGFPTINGDVLFEASYDACLR
jgi:hypothetical protein